MATVDPSSPPAGTAHGARPVVLVAAATTRAAERAVRHADTLFGEHEYVSLMVEDPAAVVDDLAREHGAVAVVVGVDLSNDAGTESSMLHLIRSSACPVVVVAV